MKLQYMYSFIFGLMIVSSFPVFAGKTTITAIHKKDSLKAFIEAQNNAGKVVVIKFYAPWCGACQGMKRVFKNFCKNTDASRVACVKVNTDKAKSITKEYNIQGVPTFIYVHKGKVIQTLVGTGSLKSLMAPIDKAFAQ